MMRINPFVQDLVAVCIFPSKTKAVSGMHNYFYLHKILTGRGCLQILLKLIWLYIFLSMIITKTPWLTRPAVEPIGTTAGVGTLLLT